MKPLYFLFAILLLFAPSTISASGIVNSSNSTLAFQNGNVVLYVYVNDTCTGSVYNNSNAQAALAVTDCETGKAPVSGVVGLVPIWAITPAFAGLSAFGIYNNNLTVNTYPIYNGTAIVTQCGVSTSQAACRNKSLYIYSPLYELAEEAIGFSNGIDGLLAGVLPNPARDIIVSPLENSTYSKTYVIRVSVLDPNIFPNATTGTCKEVAPSSLPNPTANCLNSTVALAAAINTTDNAISAINRESPVWQVLGMPTKQAVIMLITQNPRVSILKAIPNSYTITFASNINTPNTNRLGFSLVKMQALMVGQSGTLNTTAKTTVTTIGVGQAYPQKNTTTSINAAPSNTTNDSARSRAGSDDTGVWIIVGIALAVIAAIIIVEVYDAIRSDAALKDGKD